MNEKQSFIIEDLDEYHLVIKADDEYRVRRDLETEVCCKVHHTLPNNVLIRSLAREEHLQLRLGPQDMSVCPYYLRLNIMRAPRHQIPRMYLVPRPIALYLGTPLRLLASLPIEKQSVRGF